LKGLASLVSLEARQTKITDRDLVSLEGMIALRQLDLADTVVTEAGIRSLLARIDKALNHPTGIEHQGRMGDHGTGP
jgi:hypothetical protein